MKTKNLPSTFIALIIALNAFTQPVVKIQKAIGGDSTDRFTSMDITRDGGLIIGGTSYSGISGEKTQGVKDGTSSDYWVVKLNSKGQIEWDKTIGGSGEDKLAGVRQTKDGGYILAGRSLSGISGDKTETGKLWVVKLDGAGNILWDKTYSDHSPDPDDPGYYNVDGARAVQSTNDGGFIMNVEIFGADSYAEPTWIVKADADGNFQWDYRVGYESSLTKASAIIQTRDSGYLVGYTDLGHTDEVLYYGISKLDKNGSHKWTKSFYGNAGTTSILTSLVELNNGNFILGGYSDDYAGTYKSQDSHAGNIDYWLLETDRLGTYKSDKTIGGLHQDYLLDMIKTKDKGLILAGYSYSNASYEKSENNRGGGGIYDADYWIVKLDSKNQIEWDKTIGGETTDILVNIREPKRNKFVLGGYSYSGISGDKTKLSRGDADYWLVGLQYTITSLSQSGIQQKATAGTDRNDGLSVYPNPAKNILHVQTNGKAMVELSSQSGKIIFTKIINGNGEINVANLPEGVYYLKNNETGVSKKIIITK